MARKSIFREGSVGEVSFNMTPMVDVTFQLIIFFIIAGQMASSSFAKLELHRPLESQAIPQKEMETPHKVIVNVLSAEGEPGSNPAIANQASRYEIDGTRIRLGDIDRLVKVFDIRRKASGSKDFFVEIRADYRVSFAYVTPVMEAAAEAEISKMNITALTNVGD